MTTPGQHVVGALAILTHQAKRTALERALDAFAFGRGTREDMLTIARESPLEFIQITVRRSEPPKPGARIPLPLRGSSGGPLSAEGRAVTQAGSRRHDGTWAAWWSREEMLAAGKPKPPTKHRRKKAVAP